MGSCLISSHASALISHFSPPAPLLPDLLKHQGHFLPFKDTLGLPPSPSPSVGKTFLFPEPLKTKSKIIKVKCVGEERVFLEPWVPGWTENKLMRPAQQKRSTQHRCIVFSYKCPWHRSLPKEMKTWRNCEPWVFLWLVWWRAGGRGGMW